MKKIDNIEQFDDLLKQQFDSFAPEPPVQVWKNLSQNPAIGNISVASKFVSAVKSMSLVSKAIMALAVVGASAVSVALLKVDKPKQISNNTIKQVPAIGQNPNVLEEPKVPNDDLKIKIKNGAQTKSATPITSYKVEKYNKDKTENDLVEKSLGLTNQELKTELKPIANETPERQSQAEKIISKLTIAENPSTKEHEFNTSATYANSFLDVDTIIAPDIPNTFTPGDDDNLNKEFVIKIENESIYRLRVFDSKANLVFESFKKETHWNGQHFKTGENCESARYFYIFDYQYKGAKELRQESGYILLTR